MICSLCDFEILDPRQAIDLPPPEGTDGPMRPAHAHCAWRRKMYPTDKCTVCGEIDWDIDDYTDGDDGELVGFFVCKTKKDCGACGGTGLEPKRNPEAFAEVLMEERAACEACEGDGRIWCTGSIVWSFRGEESRENGGDR